MITSIFNLRESGFTHSYNHDTSVGYLKIIDNVKWEVIDDLSSCYTVKKNGVVKYSSEEFKEIVQYLEKKSNMKKISTLFKKNPENIGLVINEINPENQWVFEGQGIPTIKFDGSACAIIDGELYKRYDVKKGRQIPENAIPCQEPDEITGHHPHWVKCDRSKPEDKFFFEGFDNLEYKDNGTYELCGPKVQGNPEKLATHKLIKHGTDILFLDDVSFDYLKKVLSDPHFDIEGIVFHHKTDGRMCKIRKSDFGVKRQY